MRPSGQSPLIVALIVVSLFAAGAGFSYWSSSKVPPELKMKVSEPHNVWFQADVARVYDNMTERTSSHYRTKVHPLFSIATNPLIRLLVKFGISKELGVTLLMTTAAGFWLLLLFSILRSLGSRSGDAILFSLLGLMSSAAFFWMCVPETYLFGSVTILLVLAVSAATKGGSVRESRYMLLSAASLSVTVTNWMAGIADTFVNNPWRRSIQITINAFFVVAVLWALQKALIPSAEFFLVLDEETEFVLLEESGGVFEKTRAFFSHSMLMPEVAYLDNPVTDAWPQLSVQLAPMGSTGAIGLAGTILWLILLGYGIFASARDTGDARFRRVLGLIVAGQFLLHLVYGSETFLYSLHWLPLLVILASYGARTSLRPIVIAGAAVLLALVATNNVRQFRHVSESLQFTGTIATSETERRLLTDAIEEHPSSSWPRGEGHVILASPGSALENKAYHEPGGNFSPGFASFGVSFEFFDEEGSWIASSNSIPMDEIEQRLETESRAIITETKLYGAAWRPLEGGGWRLDLAPSAPDSQIAVVKVSSAGPAGGPIHRLSWEDNTLSVNEDRSIAITPGPELVLFQDEREPLTIRHDGTTDGWQSEDGFGTALLVLSADREYRLTIGPNSRFPDSDERVVPGQERVSISLADDEFERSLDAQVFHLLNGIVGTETRPGDPANYPLNWLRDGAYVIVALAKVGEIAVARSLAGEFLERDFFGGFGAEADAPGLAIWALDEVATRVDDVDYTAALWPHIGRKANLILEMLDAKRTVSEPFSGPVVPSLRDRSYGYLSHVAKASENGLIRGKMDNQYPIFFVNAVSYMGLTRAAQFAVRVGDKSNAERYRRRAASLKAALSSLLERSTGAINPRTLTSGFWPSDAVEPRQLYIRLLTEDWEQERDLSGDFLDRPKWTYFDVAKAHQWLFAGELDRTWEIVRWFWDNQASPGLYTWWEGDGEENSFLLWRNARGWTSPPHVTPHYWTAAEMLLLQLDMLAYEHQREGDTRIVIGGGLSADMLEEPVAVDGLQMRNGRLDWRWNGEQVGVIWHGRGSPHFVLGQGFPAGTDLDIVIAGRVQDRPVHTTESGH